MLKQYSVKQIASDLNVTTQHIRKYLKTKKITGRKIGNSWVISAAERDKLIHLQKKKIARKVRLQIKKLEFEENSGEI